MALIQCTECNNEVSSLATACPKCGAPIAFAAGGAPAFSATHVTPIEQTGKRYKGQMLIASLVCAGGVVLAIAGSPAIGLAALVIGVVWYFIARFGAWWDHG